jgi:hypothetical protein
MEVDAPIGGDEATGWISRCLADHVGPGGAPIERDIGAGPAAVIPGDDGISPCMNEGDIL